MTRHRMVILAPCYMTRPYFALAQVVCVLARLGEGLADRLITAYQYCPSEAFIVLVVKTLSDAALFHFRNHDDASRLPDIAYRLPLKRSEYGSQAIH